MAGLTPITGEGSGAFQPQVGILATGFVLDVKGAVSSDRRYVTMNVHFQLTKPLGNETTSTFGGAAGGAGFGGGGGAGFSGTIELPKILTKDLWVTTSVPDKGTALLGGQRTMEEYETEVGVPVLSKIPYINRFFTNRVTSTEEVTQHSRSSVLKSSFNRKTRICSSRVCSTRSEPVPPTCLDRIR